MSTIRSAGSRLDTCFTKKAFIDGKGPEEGKAAILAKVTRTISPFLHIFPLNPENPYLLKNWTSFISLQKYFTLF